MKILLDQCVPRTYLRLLTEWEHDVMLLNEHIPPDSVDDDVIALAQNLDAILLTVDLDFANILSYQPEKYGGIIVMRYGISDENNINNTLKAVLDDMSQEQIKGSLIIISPGRYRIRR